MFRSSRNIVLTLLGSAAMLGCCFTSCIGEADEPVRDANGNAVVDANGRPVYHHHYFWHPWLFGSTGHNTTFWHSSPYVYSSAGRTGGGSFGTSTAGATSRGGFGSTGHAAAGS